MNIVAIAGIMWGGACYMLIFRFHLLGDGVTWEHIDQVQNEVMVEVKLAIRDKEIGIF